MESVDLEMNDIFEEVDEDDDVGALGALPDLPDSTQNEDQDDDADQEDVEKRLKALSKGAAKKVVRRPQPKLDADRLTGSRGIPILPKIGEKLKFKGKNHEAEDLAQLMREMEHWAHRLFPKMPFDEVVERVEKLGSKGPVKTCIRKMRLDMPVLEDEFVGSDKEEDDIERIGDDSAQAPRNEENMWDDMMEEQAQIRLWEDRDAGPREDRRGDESSSETLRSDGTNRPSDVPGALQIQTPSQKPSTSGTFTPEQLARMERNKQMALERKLKKAGIMSPALKKPEPVASEIYTATPLRNMPLTKDTSNSCSQGDVGDSENQMSEVIQPGTSQNVVMEKRQEDAQKWCTQSDSAGDRAGNVLANPDVVDDLVDESKEEGHSIGKSSGCTNSFAVLNEPDDESISNIKEMDKEKKDLNKDITADQTDTEKSIGAFTDSAEMSEVIPNQNLENIVLKSVVNDNVVVNTKIDDGNKVSKQVMPVSSEMEIDSEDKENSVSTDIKDKVYRGDIKCVDDEVKMADNAVGDEFDDEITVDQLMESLNE